MALLTPSPKFQAFDSNGDPLSGGKLYTYVAGTTTPLATYTDQGGGTSNANPVVLDSRGEADVWLSPTSSYKLVLKTSADVTIWTVDSISATGLATDVQNSSYTLIASVSGTNTITGSVSPTPSAYANGQAFILKPAATNTGATTINLNSLGAKSIFSAGAACAGGELVSGVPVLIVYDGTQFNIIGNYSFSDAIAQISGSSDSTKKIRFEVDGLTTGTTRVLTVQDSNHTIVGRDTTDTLTNKTFGMGTGAGTATPVTVAHVNTTAVGNVGSGEDDLMSYSLPANSLSANGKAVRITAQGFTANNANAKTLKFYWGVLAGTWTMTTGAAYGWRIQATFTRTGSNTQDIALLVTESNLNGGLNADKSDQLIGGGHTQTDSGAITIKCTGEATSNNDIVHDYLLVEFLN